MNWILAPGSLAPAPGIFDTMGHKTLRVIVQSNYQPPQFTPQGDVIWTPELRRALLNSWSTFAYKRQPYASEVRKRMRDIYSVPVDEFGITTEQVRKFMKLILPKKQPQSRKPKQTPASANIVPITTCPVLMIDPPDSIGQNMSPHETNPESPNSFASNMTPPPLPIPVLPEEDVFWNEKLTELFPT